MVFRSRQAGISSFKKVSGKPKTLVSRKKSECTDRNDRKQKGSLLLARKRSLHNHFKKHNLGLSWKENLQKLGPCIQRPKTSEGKDAGCLH